MIVTVTLNPSPDRTIEDRLVQATSHAVSALLTPINKGES